MAIQLDQVAAFVAGRFGTAPVDLVPVAHGEWSRAFTFRAGSADYVARFSALEEDFLKDRRAAAWASPDLPIPRILDIAPAFDGFYCLSERSHGEFFDSLDAAGLQRLLPGLFGTLDAMRRVDVSDSQGFGLWDTAGNGAYATWHDAVLSCALDLPTNRTHGWRANLAESSFGLGPFEEAFAALQKLLPFCPEAHHAVHSDLLNFNVLVQDDRISAVIDWGSSLYGDFLYDIAWLTLWQPWYTAWNGIDIAAAARQHYAAIGLDVPHFAQRLRCYELHIGLDGIAYQAWKRGWTNVEWTTRRTLDLARSARI